MCPVPARPLRSSLCPHVHTLQRQSLSHGCTLPLLSNHNGGAYAQKGAMGVVYGMFNVNKLLDLRTALLLHSKDDRNPARSRQEPPSTDERTHNPWTQPNHHHGSSQPNVRSPPRCFCFSEIVCFLTKNPGPVIVRPLRCSAALTTAGVSVATVH